MTDQKSNERDGQPEATDFSSLELETLDTAEEEGKRLIRHYVQRAKQLHREHLRRWGRPDQAKQELPQGVKR